MNNTQYILSFIVPYCLGVMVGLGVGGLLWRTHAIGWRNQVGYMGRHDHK